VCLPDIAERYVGKRLGQFRSATAEQADDAQVCRCRSSVAHPAVRKSVRGDRASAGRLERRGRARRGGPGGERGGYGRTGQRRWLCGRFAVRIQHLERLDACAWGPGRMAARVHDRAHESRPRLR
jgi:hypothetical protein